MTSLPTLSSVFYFFWMATWLSSAASIHISSSSVSRGKDIPTCQFSNTGQRPLMQCLPNIAERYTGRGAHDSRSICVP
ncbi:hypothetical protein B0J14DRAFT_588103 [Halenospora varia]|nr:hypothetical protein B0J14DRAFT_588103 [Halenospora varia]